MGKKKNKQFPIVSPNALSYNGPIISKAAKAEADIIETNLNFTGVIASTAGGVIDSSYSSDPSSYALAAWTSLSNVWHEYRVLGMRVEFFPNNRYSKTTVVVKPGLVVIDRSSGALIGSYQSGMNHSSCRKVSWEDPWTEEVRMQNSEEADFIACASPVPKVWIKFYADGLSVSTEYGRFFVYLLLQVRGRK